MLFKPIKIKKLNFKNRIFISPMCQYASKKGLFSDWHYKHLSRLASSDASTLMIESTAVSKVGRISENDLCLYNDSHQKSFKEMIQHLKKISDINLGIQISHAGRKGSAFPPFIKSNKELPSKKKWQTYSATALKKDKNWQTPIELNKNQIIITQKNFEKSFKLANTLNLDIVELHMAHGYLLHQFLSPICNKRIDEYGGSLDKRMRFVLEIAEKLTEICKSKIIGARITGSDCLKNGININDSIVLAEYLKQIGFDYVCVSSGGIIPITNLKFYKGYRVHLAEKIKKNAKIITRTSGMLNDAIYSNKIIKDKKTDFIAIANGIIKDPNWVINSAIKLKENKQIPLGYKKSLNY